MMDPNSAGHFDQGVDVIRERLVDDVSMDWLQGKS
jgi:hypothetical protein